MASRRRILNESEESAASDLTTGLATSIALTNALSEQLDVQRDDELREQLNIPSAASVEFPLSRLLSLKSQLSTASSFAKHQMSAQKHASSYRKIGFGQCGLIFERPGMTYILKLAKKHYEDALWVDFTAHYNVSTAFQKFNPECRVPKLYSYVAKDDTGWWTSNLSKFEDQQANDASFALPTMGLISERILPLPKITREALIDEFCPAHLRSLVRSNPVNRDCLARVYLGKRRRPGQPLPPNFTLRNFNLHLDQMLELGLPVNDYAEAMGEALAIIHWKANIDGYDIEFVLGSEAQELYTQDISLAPGLMLDDVSQLQPHTKLDAILRGNFQKRITRLWVLDFNLCAFQWKKHHAMTEEGANSIIQQLVISFFENDPYYPLPEMETKADQDLWSLFSTTYLEVAMRVLEGEASMQQLPQRFINACIQRERSKLAEGHGHGHRNEKG